MRSENDIREKIESMSHMLNNVKPGETKTESFLASAIRDQVDMLLWVLEEDGGLPPIDEDATYECFR